MRIVHCSAVLLTSFFWLVGAFPGTADTVFRAAGSDGKIDPALHGVWVSRGYGWVVEVKDAATARFYDDSETACLAEDVTVEDFLSFVRLFAADGDTVQITGEHENATVYTFDRIERIPARCGVEVVATPERTLEHFGALMATHYAFFEQYGVDWQARVASARAKVSSETDEHQLFDVLGGMLDGMRDGHLRLFAEIDGEREVVRPGRPAVGPMLDRAFLSQRRYRTVSTFQQRWYERQRKQVAKLLGKSFRSAADGQLEWGRVGRIGYLAIYGMGGFAPDDGTMADEIAGTHAAMARALGDLAATDALVVDVTINGGGHDRVSLAIAAHFADAETLAFTKRAYDAGDAPKQPFHVVPVDEARYGKPVTLLTSQYTVSAAEIFTMAMRALPRVTHRGEATRGALSDVLEKDLVNGWTLTLSNEVYLDAEDVSWEGKGVPPTDPIIVFAPETIADSRGQAIRTAIAHTEAAID